MIKRVIAGFVFLCSIVFLPPLIAMIIGIALAFFFPYYIELFFAGLALDMIGGAPVPSLYGFQHFFLALSVAALLAAFAFGRYFKLRS